jgi:hypothetical protein
VNFFNRLQGVFFNPKETLKAVSQKPVWIDALIVLLVLLIIFSAVIGPYLLQDSLQTLKNDVRRQERLGEEAFNRQIDFM